MDVEVNGGTPLRWLPIRLRGILAGAFLATGMTALAAPPQERAAILLPPVKMAPGELPTLARAAMDDLPGTPMGSTPIARRKSTGEGPAWTSGVDPNVIPAAGLSSLRERGEPRTPFLNNSKDLPPLTPSRPGAGTPPSEPRLLDRTRMPASGERLIPPLTGQPEPTQNPTAPVRGTASNGAPVMAGPPAYRWYGYGTVTPGANQYAPTGQYPKASANWYGVTGATPGAFPVPVVNPYRGVPGNEPPSYVVNPPSRGVELPKNTVIAVPPSSGVRPNPVIKPAPVSQPGVPAMPPIGSIGSGSNLPLPPLPQPVGVPRMTTPDTTSITPSSGTKPIAGLPVKTTKPVAPVGPEPLPPTLRHAPVPALPPPDLFSEPGAKLVKNEIVARAQMPETNRPDPASTLIQGVCQGRAQGVDVRWSGSRKLTVCFEVRTATDASRLVKDISARPELAPFAIDFCVLVK